MRLGSFLEGELHSLLKSVQQTPPRKKPSLAKLKQLVESAPLEGQERSRISHSLKLVETAINGASTPLKGRVEQLEGRLRELRAKREGLDGRLQELIVAVQRQERLKRNKQESAQRNEEQAALAAQYRQKQAKLSQIQRAATAASKMHRKHTVHSLVRQYHQTAL